jgi:hypothetical protein
MRLWKTHTDITKKRMGIIRRNHLMALMRQETTVHLVVSYRCHHDKWYRLHPKTPGLSIPYCLKYEDSSSFSFPYYNFTLSEVMTHMRTNSLSVDSLLLCLYQCLDLCGCDFFNPLEMTLILHRLWKTWHPYFALNLKVVDDMTNEGMSALLIRLFANAGYMERKNIRFDGRFVTRFYW